ncbi:MAG TPA: alpha/beta fold hydrolase [Candidatus Methylomirabilis sp.]|nr:alpha/beta fold hydrolase [Candidatus Methylomirabilis sp.]
MTRKRRMALTATAAFVLLLLLAWPVVWDAVLSGLLLAQIATPVQAGPLHRITDAPIRQAVTFSGDGRTIIATLYRPSQAGIGAGADSGAGTGIILVHGVNETGKDDERIVWLADLLARSGFTVLTPDLLGFKTLTIRTSDVEELVASIRFLAGRSGDVGPGRIGLIGFSYGAGPTIIAAADPRVRDHVQFVVSFGGYYDLLNVVTFVTTGHFEFQDVRGWTVPNEYTRWIFLRYNLELIPNRRDRDILREIADAKAKNPTLETGPLAATLGPEGRAAYDLLVNRQPERVAGLVRALDPRVRDQIQFLSPSRVVQDLRARLFVVHSDPDDFMPKTESLRLAAALEARGNVHLALLRVFNHVRPDFPALTLGSFFRVYIPEGSKVFWLVFDLVRQRRQGYWS